MNFTTADNTLNYLDFINTTAKTTESHLLHALANITTVGLYTSKGNTITAPVHDKVPPPSTLAMLISSLTSTTAPNVPYQQQRPGHPPKVAAEHIFPVRLPVDNWDETLNDIKSHSNHSDGGAIICIVFVVAFYIFAVLLLMTSHCRKSKDPVFESEGTETVPTLPLLQNQHLSGMGSTTTINDHSAIYAQLETGCSNYQSNSTTNDNKVNTISSPCPSLTDNNSGDNPPPDIPSTRTGIVLHTDIQQRIRQILRAVTSSSSRRSDDGDESNQGMMTAGVFQTHVV